MKHLHFDQIDSTQDFFIDQLKRGESIELVSAKRQTKGRGRSSNTWDSYDNSLAFSFQLEPANTPTLTSLEIGVLICLFAKESQLKLKWPNDILTSHSQKCGGILIQIIEEKPLIGVGLNWGNSADNNSYKTGKGSLTQDQLSDDDYKNLPAKIYQFILAHRLTDQEIITKWNELCAHKDQDVSIIDTIEERGIFKKIGPFGEAYLDINGHLKKFYAGSLVIH